MLTAAIFAAAVVAAPPFCANPAGAVDALVCADPEARRLAGFANQIVTDLWKTEEGRGVVDDADNYADYPAKRAACATTACVREAYSDRLGSLVERYYDGHVVPIRGAQAFRAKPVWREWRNLLVKDLGDGWVFVWVDAGRTHGPADLPSDWRTWASGVVRLTDDRATLQGSGDETVELARQGKTWRVRQTPECVDLCAPMSGDYRPTRRRFWEHP